MNYARATSGCWLVFGALVLVSAAISLRQDGFGLANALRSLGGVGIVFTALYTLWRPERQRSKWADSPLHFGFVAVGTVLYTGGVVLQLL